VLDLDAVSEQQVANRRTRLRLYLGAGRAQQCVRQDG
jgi:hypothetical protein